MCTCQKYRLRCWRRIWGRSSRGWLTRGGFDELIVLFFLLNKGKVAGVVSVDNFIIIIFYWLCYFFCERIGRISKCRRWFRDVWGIGMRWSICWYISLFSDVGLFWNIALWLSKSSLRLILLCYRVSIHLRWLGITFDSIEFPCINFYHVYWSALPALANGFYLYDLWKFCC